MNESLCHILIVDDHPIVTDGVERLLRAHIKAQYTQANDLTALTELITKNEFDLCICDLEFPGTKGFGLLQIIHDYLPQCPILIYTMHEEPWIISKLAESNLRRYIAGAISKHDDLQELPLAATSICNGEEHFSQTFHLLIKRHSCNESQPHCNLSERETEVLTLLMQGLSSKDMAERMCLSINTIQTYRKRLFEKMDAKNSAELVSKCKGLF